MDENEAPRYWLTGKLQCAKCGSPMQGVSGTSKTGRTYYYYYYYCAAQRRHECDMVKLRKDMVKDAVVQVLRETLNDSENLASLAVDSSMYYKRTFSVEEKHACRAGLLIFLLIPPFFLCW